MSEGGITALEDVLRLRPTWINGGIELPGQGGRSIVAMLAVAAGLCSHVLCFRTVWEATYGARQQRATSGPGARARSRCRGAARRRRHAVATAVRRVVGRQLDRACRRRRTSTATARRARRSGGSR